MKILLLCACLLAGPGGDREKGLQCYREGRYAEAAAAFRAAIEREGDSADLQFNLALASWRAGDLATAETAVEKYAAMASDARAELHAGLLGALRHEEAKLHEAKADALMAGSGQPAAAPDAAPEDPLPLLEQALRKAVQSQDYFLRAVKAKPVPELLRNVERSLRTIEEIEKKIEELKKQREEKKDGEKKPDEKNKQNQDDKKDDNKDDQKPDDQKPDDQKKPGDDKSDPNKDDKKPGEKQDQQQQDPQQQDKKAEGKGDEKPEPKPGEQEQKGDESKPQPDKPEEPKSGDKSPSEPEPQPEPQPEPKPGEKPRTDAPGEVAEGKELSPEQTQRLLEQLENLDGKLKSFRARAKTGRRPVERDW